MLRCESHSLPGGGDRMECRFVHLNVDVRIDADGFDSHEGR